MDIGEKIKKLRKDKKISQSELAKQIGITLFGIRSWEKERTLPKASEIIKICRFFEVSSDWLLGLKN